ncbi:hypothetical protein C8A01DRAFT_50957 [Parachaetomium inaequale]|uniref:Uncharacterized protein n=1 Tax=Parachaetomium inaequale TaxID=2588326 RepID=A0AAN6SLM7_9PEZI|nr:hypothetical protein C8A01DRAFT_50957 [Parachaetomium inaequale]
MCDNDPDIPFCSPQNGSQLQVGETVEITWNPLFFTTSTPQPSPQIFIQADFSITDNGPPETAGFTSAPLDPNTGVFPWPVLDTYLPRNSNYTTATLSIAAPLSHTSTNGTFVRIGAGTIRFPGPQVHILRAPATNLNTSLSNTAPQDNTQPQQEQDQQQQQQQTNPLAIALPITFGLLTALAMVIYALLKRHRPGLLARVNPFHHRRGGSSSNNTIWPGGDGERHSRGRRVRLKGRDVEIRVVKTDLEGLRANAARMVAVGGGVGGAGRGEGNVFREEVRRQEVDRGRV